MYNWLLVSARTLNLQNAIFGQETYNQYSKSTIFERLISIIE